MKKYDLIVAGGGFAGVGAALAAAREGLSVLLFDKSGSLGGAAGNCLVNPFMPYWTNVAENGVKKRKYLSTGIFGEITDTVEKMGGACFEEHQTFHEEYLKLALERMLIKENIELLYHSYLIETSCENGKVSSIKVANKSGTIKLTADYFIDATGDADLAYQAGFPCRLGREQDNLCQPMTLCFRVANVDIEKFQKDRHNANEKYKKLKAEGKIRNIREDILIFPTMINGTLHFNSTRIVKLNPVNAFDITKAEIEAREQVFELFDFMVKNCDGFQNAQISSVAYEIGVRESRMIEGDFVLTQEDLIACKKFDDAIAACNYDIDIHNPEGSGTSHYYFKDGTYYTIPYRCLMPKSTKNVLVAGRCLSSTHEAQASYRIMPVCCCTGQAAGSAVSVAFKQKADVGDIDAREIQKILSKNNAFYGEI